MKNIFNFRKAAALILAVSFCLPLFSQEVDISAVYRQVDSALESRSADAISELLKKYRGTSAYSMIESYTLKKTRQLIISDDLELARSTSLAVIDNNIENFDAIDLYSYIDKAILNEQAYQQALENRRRLEEERIAALNAKSKQKIENRGNYQIVNTASGREVYMNERNASFSTYDWTVKLGLADFMYQMISGLDASKYAVEEYTSLKYGLAFGFDLFYPTERFVFGTNLSADALILTMGQGEQEFIASAKLVPEIAFADLSKHLFFRFGVGLNALATNDVTLSGSEETFFTPLVGIALDNLNLGAVKAKAFCDYDFGSLAYEDINLAMEFGASLLFPLVENERTKIGIELGAQDLLLMRNPGMENRVKFTFAIGVGNVQK
ncbi:MAG: hypothetical protein KBT11_09510 [Treponema sp.]|nr:hypothetical protein [Candidatus Treponema equifaecale]